MARKRKNVSELTNLYYVAMGNLELFRSTGDRFFAEAAIKAYSDYKSFGGKKTDEKLDRVLKQRAEEQFGKQVDFFDDLPKRKKVCNF